MVPTTNLQKLIVSPKKRNIFCDWEGFIGRYIFVIISGGGEVWRVKRNNLVKNFFTLLSLSLSSFLIYLFFPSLFSGTIFEYCKSSTSDRER